MSMDKYNVHMYIVVYAMVVCVYRMELPITHVHVLMAILALFVRLTLTTAFLDHV